MTTEPARPPAAEDALFLPADGLRLLGQQQSGDAGRRFLVGRGDGQVIPLPLLPYLIMAAIAEGGVDGGWSAEQVGARVESASGQGLTADTVRYLIAGKLAPLGLIAADDVGGAADRAAGSAGLGGVGGGGGGAVGVVGVVGAVGRVLSWPLAGRGERARLLLRRRWGLALGAAAVLVCVAATAPIVAEAGNRAPGGAGAAPTSSGSAASAAASAASPAALAAAGPSSRSQAAAWVAQQVSPDITVACDPGLCGQLRRDGFPAARLRPGPGGARALLGSVVVVATAAIRSQFGAPLATAYAPEVIASFGSGAGRVDVRLIAPAGLTAFRTRRATEQTALAAAGRQLLGNQNILASSAARAALRAGQVDARLLTILSLLAAQRPVRLVAFTGAPGAGAGVPLRSAEIGVTSPAARSAVLALLDAQQGPYRPAAATAIGGSRAVVAVRFDAPAVLDIAQP